MDSKGGNLEEAINLGRHFSKLGLPTIIPPDAICYSACAIAFLYGKYSYVSGGGAVYHVRRRELYAGGRLGFHAPDIPIADGTPVTASMVRSAYSDAIEQAGEIFDDLESDDALTMLRFLTTPSNEMHVYETVSDLNEIRLSLLGVLPPSTLDAQNLAMICQNAFRYTLDTSTSDIGGCAPIDGFGATRLKYERKDSYIHGTFKTSGFTCWKHPSECQPTIGFTEENGRISEWNVAVSIDPDDLVLPRVEFVKAWIYPPATRLEDVSNFNGDQRLSWAEAVRWPAMSEVKEFRVFLNKYGFVATGASGDDYENTIVYLGISCDTIVIESGRTLEKVQSWSYSPSDGTLNIGNEYELKGVLPEHNHHLADKAEALLDACR